MANKVLSIEIGQSITKVVEVDYKSNKPKIYNYFSFATPEGTVEDGVIGEKKADFCRFLKRGLTKNGITTTRTIFTVNSKSIANREVTIPLVKEKKIQQLLIANSSEYFPISISGYQLAYHILEKNEEEKQYKLQVYAIPRKLIDSYEEIAKVCSLNIVAMDYTANSICQVMNMLAPQGLAVTLKVDETLTVVTITKDGKVMLQRNVAYGLDGVIESISRSMIIGYKPQFDDIYRYMRKSQCVRAHIHEEVPEDAKEDEKLTKLLDEATDSVRYLIGNISRVLDFYTSRNDGAVIDKITLMGFGAECVGLKELMTNELGVPVVSETTFDSAVTGEHAANYMACVGAAISPLDLANEVATKASKGKQAESENLVLVPRVVFIACAIAAVALVGIPLYQNIVLKSRQSDLENRITQLQDAQIAFNAYNQAVSAYIDAKTMESYTATEDDALLDFLVEFEKNVPADVMLDNLTAGTTGVTMSLTAEGKEELGELIVQLRQFETVGSVTSDGFMETTTDTGEKKLNCTVTCTYASAAEGSVDDIGTDLDSILEYISGNTETVGQEE